ncbi:carotenoid biosynthesis protein [Kamptonema cortianum]|nr:carotenoid biosynthesis protein [Kamptonema cortianum]
MQKQTPLIQKITTFFWLFFIVWISVGIAAALAGQTMPRWMHWADAWTMILATIITYLWMIDLHGVRKTRICFAIILIASGLIEFIGTNTGFPFGHFKYTERFSATINLPFAPNGLAIIIPFAWAVLCLNAWFLAGQILKWRNRWAICALAGVITMLTDVNLEAVAWYMRGFDEAYWRWYADGTFTQIAQTVPVQNYIAWFVLTVIFLALCPLQMAAPAKTNWKPLVILAAFNLLFLAHRIHYTWLMEDDPVPTEIEFSGRAMPSDLRLVNAALPFDSAGGRLNP